MHTRLQEEENGDLYYCLARVYKYIGDSEEYCSNLELALNNPYTLTFPKKIIKQELEYIEQKLDRNDQPEPQAHIEEYSESEEETGTDEAEEESEEDFSEDDDEEDNNIDEEEEETDYSDDIEDEEYNEEDEEPEDEDLDDSEDEDE